MLQLCPDQSALMFGARGTGKSTLLKQLFPNAIWLDLLKPQMEERFQRRPEELAQIVTHALDASQPPSNPPLIVIDEIQKCPKLLDVVHDLIESTPCRFVMTGSSARKLHSGAANLLAGRAFVYRLHPLTHRELGDNFHLDTVLRWGSMPKVAGLKGDQARRLFLQSYAQTYLKEEIWAEQLIRRLEPFRRFLEVAAQSDGLIVNFSKLAQEVGVDPKTVQTYFDILVETHLGFWLESYHTSIRKQLRMAPKFYLFDIGVSRALSRTLNLPVLEKTSAYGERFEQWIIQECFRLNDYLGSDFRFSYLQAKSGAEVDLVVERPGQPLLLIEIKSGTSVSEEKLRSLERFQQDLQCEAWCLCGEPIPRQQRNVTLWPWIEGLKQLFA